MKILAVESSATAASVALLSGEQVVGQFYIHTSLTHSQTLVPMLDALLKTTDTVWESIDAFAVATGPGSFTGIRIGVSTVKGIAFSKNIPCVGVSTLEAMAASLRHMEGKTLCCVMDARCKQVYNAVFRVEAGKTVRLCDDRALSIEVLTTELCDRHSDIVLVGDGAELCFVAMNQQIPSITMAPAHLRIQSAVGVGLKALDMARSGQTVSSVALVPNYLRLPQAERELRKKQEGEKEK